MEYKAHHITSKSSLHVNNEDSFRVSDDYVIVADGMGGERDGAVASRLAVDAIAGVLSGGMHLAADETGMKKLLADAIDCADSRILEYIGRNPDSFGMGTTVLLAIRKEDRIFISWCGDSHCYSYDNGCLHSLTKDHSYVQELVDAGEISEEESYAHPDNNLITRYVGGGKETCGPDFISRRLSGSEVIIMCSDGLSGYCQSKEIEKVVAKCKDMSRLPSRLRNLALRHGSDDDITIVVLAPMSVNLGNHEASIFGWLKKMMHD